MNNITGNIAKIIESDDNIFIAHCLVLFSYNESSMYSMTIRIKYDRRKIILKTIGVA